MTPNVGTCYLYIANEKMEVPDHTARSRNWGQWSYFCPNQVATLTSKVAPSTAPTRSLENVPSGSGHSHESMEYTNYTNLACAKELFSLRGLLLKAIWCRRHEIKGWEGIRTLFSRPFTHFLSPPSQGSDLKILAAGVWQSLRNQGKTKNKDLSSFIKETTLESTVHLFLL